MGSFDPYYTWLGIRPEEQPPHHYRLLGLQLFEDNLDAIEHAADRQMAHLRTLQTGKHAELSQRLLNEVASAKVCLLKPDKKAAYDAALREQLSDQLVPVPVAEPLATPFDAIKPGKPGLTPRHGSHKPPPATLYLLIAAAAVAVVILGLLLWPRSAGQAPSSTVASQTPEPPPQPPVKPKPQADPVATAPQPLAAPPPPKAPPPSAADSAPPPVAKTPPAPAPQGESLPIGQWVDVLPYADLEWGRVDGDWSRQPEGIVAGLWMQEKIPSRLALPVEIDGDYDVEVELTRNQRDLVAGVILPVGSKRVTLRCDMKNRFGRPVSGLEPVEGKSAMHGSTAQEGAAFTTGRRARLMIQVRLLGDQASVHASIDGKPFFQWTGPQTSLSLPTRYWSLPGKNPLGLTNNLCEVTFHSVRLRMVSGKATVTRPVSSTPPTTPSKAAEPPAKPEATNEKRLPLPSAADQEKASSQIDEVYQLKQSRSTAQKVALARELLALSRRAETAPVERFVLLRTTVDIAREGGDAVLMLQATDAIAAQFEVDLLPLQAKTLGQFAKSDPEGASLKGLVEVADRTIAQALADNRYDLAMELAEETYRLGQKPQGKAFRKQTYDRRNEVKKLYERWQETQQSLAAVKAKPEDPEANLAAGRWYCFEKGDWRQGLPHLAKGNDDTLKALAQQELSSPPREPADQVKLADAWFALAQSMDGHPKGEVLLHAGAWYRQAELSGISGLLATKVAKDLKEIARLGRPIPDMPGGEPQPGQELSAGLWVNVLKWADVEWGPPVGKWSRRAEEILAGYAPWTLGEGHPRLALPVAIEGDYDLRMECTRTGHSFMVGAILPVGSRHLAMAFDHGSANDKVAGLELIDGKGLRDNPTTKRGPAVLTNGQRYTILHRVRLEGDRVRIEVFLNGQSFLQWTGPHTSLMIEFRPYALPGKNLPGLIASNCEVTFHAVWLRPLSGKATRVDVTGKPTQ